MRIGQLRKMFNGITEAITPKVTMDFPPFEITIRVRNDEWAPGLFAGSEGMKLTVKSVDLENQTLTLVVGG